LHHQKGGRIPTYQYKDDNPDGPLRNCINYEKDLKKTDVNKSYHGVKSKTI
jgi:hypothetical protein